MFTENARRKRTNLLQPHCRIPTRPIKHDNRHVQLAKLPYRLPTHPAGARRRRDICSDRHRPEAPVPLRHGLGQRYALRAGPYRVAGIFDVGAADEGARGAQHGAADAEVRVGTVGGGFGGGGGGLEGAELGFGEVMGAAG